MANESSNIVETVKSVLAKHLSFEVIKQVICADNFGSAQYLQLTNLIEDFVYTILSSFSQKQSQDQGTEIGFNKIKKMLNYKDFRSVNNWCTKNNVHIINQGNSQFVNRSEFMLAFYKPFVSLLKAKHKNWKEIFVNYLNGDLMKLLPDSEVAEKVIGHYKPKTAVEKSFMKKIKEL